MNYEEAVRGVPVVRWNPLRDDPREGVPTRVNNFGDLIGPLIVERILEEAGTPQREPGSEQRLLAVGSVMHFARDGDHVWGTGVNGKVDVAELRARKLDIGAVRGPLTRDVLASLGISAPETYGDPALLLPRLFPESLEWTRWKSRRVTVIPNFNDLPAYWNDPRVVSPREDVWTVVEAIARSEFVIGSSLHAIVVADALGVPTRPFSSENEHPFKYQDYLHGTGRDDVEIAESAEHAISLGPIEAAVFDEEELMGSFPHGLWRNSPITSDSAAPAPSS